MSTWFISRHPGALEWASRQGLHIDRFATHLDIHEVQRGDTVIGNLPVNLAAVICHREARYLHLSVEVTADLRGKDLSADQLQHLGARLEEYKVTTPFKATR
jgi:CRISPR-associated protein Csx16